jgi:hypothetical protein
MYLSLFGFLLYSIYKSPICKEERTGMLCVLKVAIIMIIYLQVFKPPFQLIDRLFVLPVEIKRNAKRQMPASGHQLSI